ncbi:MAG: GNAT family N-acetyltransferase [Nocardioidaceae bacterium]
MTSLGTATYLRPVEPSDDAFLYDVFCTTWAGEVAVLPNQNLARHVLRIQHIAQERRFTSRHPGRERFVVVEDGRPVGRLYLDRTGPGNRVLDLTLLPAFQSRGLGTRVLLDLVQQARVAGVGLQLSVKRRNRRAVEWLHRLDFRLVDLDDLDDHFVWPAPQRVSAEP